MNPDRNPVLDAHLERQRDAWLSGSRPSVDELLRMFGLPRTSEVVLDLIYNEIVAREEIGETPGPEEFLSRFPELRDELMLHFEVHAALREDLAAETPANAQLESVPDSAGADREAWPRLDGYDVLGELGRGGMGVVYRARDRRLDREVALKMLRPNCRPTSRELGRFRAEAAAVARLQHPNIVQIFAVGEHEGLPYLVLELADRGTLQRTLHDRTLSARDAAELVARLARAVDHAHRRRIVHRDLKPANVLFAAHGVPKIADFGLAKILDPLPGVTVTRSGEPVGTPRYMAPEQAEGDAASVGPQADVYALGNILYECLVGQAPFVATTVAETLERIRRDDPIPPRRLQRAIPRDLETICLHCLNKRPERRYADAGALAEDLGRFLDGRPVSARRTPAWERAWMACRRRPATATAIGAAALAFAFGLLFFLVRERREVQRLDSVRASVVALVGEGQQALAAGDVRIARERFETALARAQAEPVLADHELGIRGWLDHAIRDGEQDRWRIRRRPPLFEERRDDALVQAALAHDDAIASARRTVADALSFASTDGAAWNEERELLTCVDASLLRESGDVAGAAALLDATPQPRLRVSQALRAELREAAGRTAEAAADRARTATLAENPRADALVLCYAHLRGRRFADAIAAADRALAHYPDDHTLRCLQAVALLEAGRASEAKIAFTACLGQRPRFAWCRILRGAAYGQLGEFTLAAQDFQFASETTLGPAADARLQACVSDLGQALAAQSTERRQAWFSEPIWVEGERLPTAQAPVLQPIARRFQEERRATPR